MAEFERRAHDLRRVLAKIANARSPIAAAEGHLRKLSGILLEMKTKAERAASETLSAEERAAILAELQELNAQIDEQMSRALPSIAAMMGELGYEEASLKVAKASGQGTSNRITNSHMARQQLEETKRVILELTHIALAAQANVDSRAVRELLR